MNLKAVLTWLGILLGIAAGLLAQTATPVPTNTPTPTVTPLPAPPQPALTLVVPSGGTLSNQATLNEGEVFTITVYAPATVAEAVTFDVADVGGGTFRTYQQVIGTDSTVAAGKAIVLTDVTAAAFRIKLGGAAAAARSFVVLAVRKGRA